MGDNKFIELLQIIDANGGVEFYGRSDNSQNAWNAAFTLYNRENKKIRAGCGECAKKVYTWLTSKN